MALTLRVRPDASPILRFFYYNKFEDRSHSVESNFLDLALTLEEHVPDSAEKSAGLRKLLEARDCFVRATMPSAEI